jgi:transposase
MPEDIHLSKKNKIGLYLTNFQRKQLEKNLQDLNLTKRDFNRIQIMLLADEGKSQAEICRIIGCAAATARQWIHFAESGKAQRWKEKSVGHPRTITDEYLERLQELVAIDPHDVGEHFDRWTGFSLSRRLYREFGIKVTQHHVNRLLKRYGLSHSQLSIDPQAIDRDNSKLSNNEISHRVIR